MRALSILILAALAGCSAPAEAPKPSQAAAETFKGCEWAEVRGKTLSIWSFACGPDYGGAHLEADDTLPGFRLVSDGVQPGQPVIRVFAKPADAPMDAILPAVRAASPGPDIATCTFQPSVNPAGAGQVYQFAPTA
jgi:hypothetical protein